MRAGCQLSCSEPGVNGSPNTFALARGGQHDHGAEVSREATWVRGAGPVAATSDDLPHEGYELAAGEQAGLKAFTAPELKHLRFARARRSPAATTAPATRVGREDDVQICRLYAELDANWDPLSFPGIHSAIDLGFVAGVDRNTIDRQCHHVRSKSKGEVSARLNVRSLSQ